jgi:putative thioredoxin
MAESPYTFEGTQENFAALVLDNSARGVVVVNYWAPWAGPCFKLWPVLSKLSSEYAGRFLLVNVNTDRYPALAKDRRVNSLPTVQIYRHGKVVAEVHGAESEPSLRKLIDRFVARPSDPLVSRAVGAYREGRREEAVKLLREAEALDPDNPRIRLTHSKLLIQARDYDGATEVLSSLPEAERAGPEARRLLAHLDFLQSAWSAPDRAVLEQGLLREPEDLDARYGLAALDLVQDDYRGAMEQLIEILRREPGYRAGAAHRGLLALFDLLGPEHELVGRYRPRLFDLLH